ncbi:MAG: peptidoglycan recognition family protein [Thermosynechococcaceae cyanobacterium]
MHRKFGFVFYGLSSVALISVGVLPSQAYLASRQPSHSDALLAQAAPGIPVQGCLTRPPQKPVDINVETRFTPGQITLDRFRKQPGPPGLSAEATRTNVSQQALDFVAQHQPVERVSLANPTNFGERYLYDFLGKPAYHPPIVVLHETVISGPQTLRLFSTYHPKSSQQVSYHTLIMTDGTIYYLVPPDKRAFGAGTSVFASPNGNETVTTNPSLSSSVNNFAYHISLVSPVDGYRDGLKAHSGYTSAQYYSLAWLIAKTGVPVERITTHQAVDRAGNRSDPRSFNREGFLKLLELYPKTNEVMIGCPSQAAG